MSKILEQALVATSAHVAFTPSPVISMEEELIAIDSAVEAAIAVDNTVAETDHAEALVGALEDLQFVVDDIEKPSPREAALIQITADVATAGTGVSGEVIAPSMEDGTVDKGRIGQKIAAIIKVIREALAALVEKITSFITSYTSMSGNIHRRYQDLGKRLGKAKNGNPTVKIKQLYPFNAKEAAALENMEVSLLNGNSSIIYAVSNVVMAIAIGETKERISKKFKELLGVGKPKNVQLESRLLETGQREYSYEGLGGVIKITACILESGEFDESDNLTQISSKIRGLGYSVSYSSEYTPVETKVPTIGELIANYKALEYMVTNITDSKSENTLLGNLVFRRDFQKRFSEEISGKIGNTIDDEISSSVAKGGGMVSQSAMATSSMLNTMARMSSQPYTKLISFLARTINQQMTYINACLDAHEAALKSEDKKE